MTASHTPHRLGAILLFASIFFSCANREEAGEEGPVGDQAAMLASAEPVVESAGQPLTYEQIKVEADIAAGIAKAAADLAAAAAKVEADRLAVERKRTAEQEAMFKRDIMDAMQTLVENANRVAEQEDGKVYLRTQALERVVYFVPGESLGDQYPKEDWYSLSDGVILKDVDPETYAGSWKPKVEEQAISTRWTDEYIVASEQEYRYSEPTTVSIKQRLYEPYLVATVRVTFQWSMRWSVSGVTATLPLEPEGYRYWHPDLFAIGHLGGRMGGRRNLRAAYSPGVLDVDFQLEPVVPPDGVLLTQHQKLDPLASDAIEALGAKAMREQAKELTLYLKYSFGLKRWVLDSPHIPPTIPVPALPWTHGSKSYDGIYVGRPDQ